MNQVPDSQPTPDASILSVILMELSGEIRKPLTLLHRGIESLVADPHDPLTETERAQAATMLLLCQEIDRLTDHHLMPPAQPGIREAQG